MLHKPIASLRLRGPLAADPTARTLHALLAGVLAFALIAYFVQRPFSPNKPVSMWNTVLLTTATLTALLFLRRGALRAASLTYLIGMWVFATIVIRVAGGVRTFGVAYYLSLPILAAWLLGYRAALWNVALSLSAGLLFAIAETIGIWRFPTPTPLGAWIHLALATLIAAVPVAHTLRRLRDALARSRRNEEELQEYRHRLEDLVQQRTAELVEARDQATAARDQAESASRAKSRFLANMSHELRTPLSAILGFSDLLRDSGLSETQRRDMEVVHRSGEHLLGLINDVLDIAKVEAGRATLEVAPCDLGSLVSSVAEMMRVRAREKGLSLLLAAEPGFPRFVQADAAKLRQVLINLLSNAIKFTDHGSVTLRCAGRPAADAGRMIAVFEVEDTGIGIAPADQDRIFEPFVQVSTAGRAGGTGLGLSITRQFIELMGGVIEVESKPGVGSRFRIEAPLVPAREFEGGEALQHEEPVVHLAPGEPERRILVVEDESANRTLLERLLESAGFQVRVAENGAAGVEMFRQWRPHFIWMDVRMPVMDGVEATRRIRALEGGREVKIAAVSASRFASEREELVAAGMDDFVCKPYRREEILACLGRHLGVRYCRVAGAAGLNSEDTGLRPESLASLPAAVRRDLAAAVVSLNAERVLAVIDRIAAIDPEVAGALRRLAERLSYSAIYHAMAVPNTKELRPQGRRPR